MHLVRPILQIHQGKNRISDLTRQLILNYGERKIYTLELSVQLPVSMTSRHLPLGFGTRNALDTQSEFLSAPRGRRNP